MYTEFIFDLKHNTSQTVYITVFYKLPRLAAALSEREG